MQALRIGFLAVLGGLVGAFAWMSYEYLYSKEATWLCLASGLLAGLAVRAGGFQVRSSYLAGAIAAIVTLASMLAAVQAHSEFVVRTTQSTKAASSLIAKSPAPAPVETGDEIEATEVLEVAERPMAERGPVTGSQQPWRNSMSTTALLFFSLSCLLAYVLAGSASSPARSSSETAAAEVS